MTAQQCVNIALHHGTIDSQARTAKDFQGPIEYFCMLKTDKRIIGHKTFQCSPWAMNICREPMNN